MFKWLNELIEIKERWDSIKRDNKVCESCEILKHELEMVRLENRQLLDRILEKPKIEEPTRTEGLKPIVPTHIPWNVRRNMLEAEDRRKAQLLKEVSKLNKPVEDNSALSGGQTFKTEADIQKPMSVEQLEVELGVEENGAG